MPRKPQPSQQKSWDIYQARHTPAQLLGTVETATLARAIKEAAKELNAADPKN